MSHTGVDVIDFLFYTIYPVIGIFIVEIISRLFKIPKWIKLWTQAIVSTGFGIYYWFNAWQIETPPLLSLRNGGE